MKRHMFWRFHLLIMTEPILSLFLRFLAPMLPVHCYLYSKARTVLKSLAKAGGTLEFSNINDGNIRLPVDDNSELRITWNLSHSH